MARSVRKVAQQSPQRPRTTRPASGGLAPKQLAAYFQAKLAAELGPHNVKRLLDLGEPVVVLDVRSVDGYQSGHVPGARSIPFERLVDRYRELPVDQEIVTYCWDATCFLSTKAAYFLASKGYRVKEMIGGIEAWKAAGFPVEQTSAELVGVVAS